MPKYASSVLSREVFLKNDFMLPTHAVYLASIQDLAGRQNLLMHLVHQVEVPMWVSAVVGCVFDEVLDLLFT